MHPVLAPLPVAARNAASRTRRALPAAPPRPLLWVSGAVVVAGVVMGVVGAVRTGVTWDEPYHVMRLRNYLDHGWFALDWSVEGDATGPETNTVVYAPVAMLLLHTLAAIVGVEGWGEVSTSPAAYDVRHLGVLLIGLVGVAAAAATTRILLSSWRWALVTAAALTALPMWTGHLMFNIKDVPVATGYTLVTLALVMMVAPVRGRRSARVLCLAVGIVLMVGTRPAMGVAVVLGLAVLAAGVLVAGRFGNARTALAEAAGGAAVAYVGLLAVYPNVFAHPTNLLASAEKSASFRDGRDAVLGYVPFHVLAQVPLLLLGFLAVGLVTSTRFAARGWRTDTSQVTRVLLVATQLLALPLVAILRGSDLYNGLRQLLFASPAWAVLVTLGIARCVTWAVTWERDRGRLRLVGATAVLALVAPVLDQLTLFPYQYAYYNVALDATGVHVPSDYWRSSVPELVAKMPTDGQVVCGPTRTGSDVDALMQAGRYSSDSSVDCRTDPLGPLSSSWLADGRPLTEALPHDQFYVEIDRDHPTPTNCTRLASVDRTRHLRTLSMTYVARCSLPPRTLDTEPVSFARTPGETTMSSTVWAYAAEGWVKRLAPDAIDAAAAEASLWFDATLACTSGCDLVLDADVPVGVRAELDGTPLDLTRRPGGANVALPAGTTTAWVTFVDPGGLRLRSIRIEGERA